MTAVGSDRSREHARRMDRMYRLQRHVYDATRKYYLFGRDAAIQGLDIPPDGSVLEIGCGTGRNLALIGRLFPQARLFGLDELEVSEADILHGAALGVARSP